MQGRGNRKTWILIPKEEWELSVQFTSVGPRRTSAGEL
jgi:hypothetical protein